jgi:hypothetical protein
MPKGVYDRGLSDTHILLVELHNKLRVTARFREIEFTLTRDQLEQFIYKDCAYCGRPPYQRMQLRRDVHGTGGVRIPVKWLTYTGLDRFDSSEGYTVENCIPCCGVCNKMKASLSYSEFINHIRRIWEKSCLG